jgi:hypothetical protein
MTDREVVECYGCGAEHYADTKALDELNRCAVCADKENNLDPHPMQQVRWDGKGVIRFRKNAIVDHLLESHPTMDLNALACMEFSQEDRIQFAQLIGYSVSGFGDLSYSSIRVTHEADLKADELVKAKRQKQAL